MNPQVLPIDSRNDSNKVVKMCETSNKCQVKIVEVKRVMQPALLSQFCREERDESN